MNMISDRPETQTHFDCLITGSGPTGMVAALRAAHAGLQVALIGPSINVEDKRTTAILGPSLDALADVGLATAFDAIGTPLMTMRILDGSRRLLRAPAISFGSDEIERDAFGLNCRNGDINRTLDDAVRASNAITRFEGFAGIIDLSNRPARVTLDSGKTVTGKAIIAADGRNSPSRNAAGISVRRWSYPQTAAVGTVSHDKPHDFISTELHTETGPFTFVPLPDQDTDSGYRHQSSFVCVLSPDLAEKFSAMEAHAANRFLEKRSLHVLGQLSLQAPVQLWPLGGLLAGSFAKRGVFLTGETGHAFPPIGAQGLNLSIRDAMDAVSTVAEALDEGRDPASMLVAARYNAKRRADVWSRTLGVDALNRSLLTGNLAIQAARAVALGAASRSSRLKQGLMVAGLAPLSVKSARDALQKIARPA
ncbi:MAG: FAD-dependent monooxygenase [Pseudomonadota bacterium]